MSASGSSIERNPAWRRNSSNLADAIAYNNHDVDDGVRAGLINVEELREVRIFSRFHAVVVSEYPDVSARRQLYETIRRMVDYLVSDLIVHAERNIAHAQG